jgi:uncharacterized membrane protein
MTNKIFIIISIFTTYLFGLVIFRVFISESTTYILMLWNLFLALIPIIITQIYYLFSKNKKTKKVITILVFGLFLLFFPNISYIVTDLMHLQWVRNFPIWYDYTLLFSF